VIPFDSVGPVRAPAGRYDPGPREFVTGTSFEFDTGGIDLGMD
jgi:hypothetical protein